MVEEKQESRQAEALRALFRRLYGDANGQTKFNLNDEQRYLTHALLQSILYELDQECPISSGIGQCINDGTTACSMNTSVFGEGRSACLRILEPDINGVFGRSAPKNPFDKQPIKEETFFFYNCAIENIFYVDPFDVYGFDVYKAQYDRAQAILRGGIDVTNIPDEVQQAVNDCQIIILEKSIHRSTSAKEIKKLLESISKETNESEDDSKIQKLKKVIKKFIETDEFKKQYDKAQTGFIEEFKNFVVKAMIAIWNFVVWFLSKENIQDFKAKCSKKFADLDTEDNTKLQSFKDYVFESQDSPLKEGLMEV